MSPDPTLPDRVRDALTRVMPVDERRMFGGIAFLIDGAIVATVRHDGDLMVRVDPSQGDALAAEPGASPATMGVDRVMGPSWVQVATTAVADADRLEYWLALALDCHRTRHAGWPDGHGPPTEPRPRLESG